MSIQDLLNLSPGSVVELDKIAGEPLDILVNDRLIARGEAVVVTTSSACASPTSSLRRNASPGCARESSRR
jgi:hypothetical protein